MGQMNHAMLCVPMQKDTLWIECTNPRMPLGYRHDNIAGHEVVLVGPNGGQKVRVRPYPDSLRHSVESVEVTLNADGSAHCVGSRHLVLDDAEAYVGFSALSEKTKLNAIMGANSLTPDNFKIVSVTDNFEDWVNMADGEEYIPQTDITYEFDAANYAKVTGDRIFLDLNPFAKQVRADRKQRVNDSVRSRMIIIEDVVESFDYNLDDASFFGTSKIISAAVYLDVIEKGMRRESQSLDNGGVANLITPKGD